MNFFSFDIVFYVIIFLGGGGHLLCFSPTLNFLSIMGDEFYEVGILFTFITSTVDVIFLFGFQNAGFYRESPPFMTYKFTCVINILVSVIFKIYIK